MIEPVPLQFAFLTMPGRKLVLNVQVEGHEIQRYEINRDHLFTLNAQTADLLMHHKDAQSNG